MREVEKWPSQVGTEGGSWVGKNVAWVGYTKPYLKK